ncbi:MAG: transcriptional repressor [Anaerolineales bacterium]|nr:transcriptional repressor [Anaerolineales bacterium]
MIINNKIDPEFRYKKMLTKIRESGGRITSHRLALIRLLAASEGHPNATQLYEALRRQFPTISLATIYKTLALLKDEGEVLEIDLHNDSHYDGNKPYSHPHLICTHCNRIFDGDIISGIQNLNQEIEEKCNFQVSRHQLVFYGLCEECQQKVS